MDLQKVISILSRHSGGKLSTFTMEGKKNPPCCCVSSLSPFDATLALGSSVHLFHALIHLKTQRLVD